MPILIKHERTTNINDRIIVIKVEKELREKNSLGVSVIYEYLRLIAKLSQSLGSTVSFFTTMMTLLVHVPAEN